MAQERLGVRSRSLETTPHSPRRSSISRGISRGAFPAEHLGTAATRAAIRS